MRVSGILDESIVDGEGIRVVVFFQGCVHKCEGCHNPSTWDITGGEYYTPRDLAKKVAKMLTDKHAGVTLSGGDPLLHTQELHQFIEYLRGRKPDVNIWCYTGFTYEQVEDNICLPEIDVLVDGKFVKDLKTLEHRFRGSSNQRVLKLKGGKVVGELT